MKSSNLGLVTGAVLLMCLFLASCTPWRSTYLQENVNKATQSDVAKRLGPPYSAIPLDGGETVWQYKYVDQDPGLGTFCTEYNLTFDRSKVLRNWQRQKC